MCPTIVEMKIAIISLFRLPLRQSSFCFRFLFPSDPLALCIFLFVLLISEKSSGIPTNICQNLLDYSWILFGFQILILKLRCTIFVVLWPGSWVVVLQPYGSMFCHSPCHSSWRWWINCALSAKRHLSLRVTSSSLFPPYTILPNPLVSVQ